jgi:nicotinamidase-related amidase
LILQEEFSPAIVYNALEVFNMVKLAALGIAAGICLGLPVLATNQSSPETKKSFTGTALLIIDIQNFYFQGGKIPLEGSLEASLQAKKMLDRFRTEGLPVVHIRHVPLNADGLDAAYAIHPNVAPGAGEKVVVKHYANSFRDTDLLDYLRRRSIGRLVICGMQTHMCVEAAVRSAADSGFEVILLEDACATRNLNFGGVEIPARQVHYAVLATLSGTYARVVKTDDLLEEFAR